MKKSIFENNKDRHDFPKFEVPLYVRCSGGDYQPCFGHLGINGFYFETSEAPLIGQIIDIKVVLLGLGMEVKTRGRVITVDKTGTFVKVAARFEEIPFETERMIARWLDMLTHARITPVAA
ncbi:MAG: PilZ domain-containing protein [Deltaproteobacteria bacterium]|nr:PilZ domain-containing protein [Deltaproteobacteria bacterium]MBW1872296.1 PilZ domain-containing protein [Deltaproteobacteria bacterium]